MPVVTVAIPAYKPTYLADAISSVLRQDFGDYELLISDDRKDGSVKDVVSRFNDPRIKLLAGPGQGLVANSAFLWDRASSDFIKYLYDDDLLAPSAVRELFSALCRSEDCIYAFCNRLLIDGKGSVLDRPRVFQGDKGIRFEADRIPNFMMENIHNKVGEPSNILIRKSAFNDSRCLSEFAGLPIRHLIDVAFYMNAGLVGPCVGIPQHLAAFRRHEEQVSSRTQAPAFSAGVFEWEIFLRGSVQLGLVAPSAALKGVPRLEHVYKIYSGRFEELQVLSQGLPSLRDSLEAGATSVITQQFRDDLQLAHRLIAQRSA